MKRNGRINTSILAAGGALVVILLLIVRFTFFVPGRNPDAGREPAVFTTLRSAGNAHLRVEEMPMWDDEYMKNRITGLLQYDHALALKCQGMRNTFMVYISHWGEGQADVRTVRLHTPDVCWTRVGWTRTKRDDAYAPRLGDRPLFPGAYRHYRSDNGQEQEVLYWHVMNGAVLPKSKYGFSFITQLVRGLLGDLHALRGEQYFVRISSETGMDELWNDPDFQRIMEIVAPLGLYQQPRS